MYVLRKKAQVTIFVLLGIVLLLSAVIFFILREGTTDMSDDTAATLLEVEEISTVQKYVTACLDEVGERAIRRAGLQGGYTDSANLAFEASYYDSTESDAFLLSPNSNLLTPYWYYLLSPNACDSDCLFFSQRPLLQGESPYSVESQIEKYVETEIASCISGFTEFTEQGYDISVKQEPQVNALIRDYDVKFILNYPLEVVKGDIYGEIAEFSSEFDVPLREMYNLAAVLAAAEGEYNYLEIHTLEMLSLFSGFDNERLPPFGGTTLNFVSPHYWSVETVKNNIQEILTVYTGGLQVKDSYNYREVNFGEEYASRNALTKIFENMVLPSTGLEQEFSRVSVNFEYLSWPWYFDVNSNGAVIEPDSIAVDYFPWFGIQRYRTFYDVSYPVRVVLQNPDAFGGRGFTFAFGLEVNVRDNEPMTIDYQREVAPEPATGLSELCNPDQRNTGNISVSVVEPGTNEPVEEAVLVYSCGDESCPLGETGSDGVYTGRFPICGGGVLSALKDGYDQNGVRYSTTLDKTDEFVLPLSKIYEIPVVLKKIPIQKTSDGQWVVSGSESDLAFSEFGTISLSRVDGDFSHTAYYEGTVTPNDRPTIRVLPGEYEVRINLIRDEAMLIPEEERERAGREYTIPEVDLKELPSGKLSLDENSQYWSITAQELAAKDQLTFYVLSFELAQVPESERQVEDLNVLADLEELSLEHIARLMPR